MRHVPLEGVVLGFLHASAAAWFLCDLPGVIVLMCVAYLCTLVTSSPWFAGAVTTLADTLPSLCWRMLCRPCFARSDRYFATLATPTLADALPLWLRCLLVVSGGCFAAVVLLLLVDAWPPSGCFVVSVSDLGDFVLCVGSPVFRSLQVG